ncbi:MAG: class I SAM-dependent methyltransferase [Ignavibacteria bacterium]
MALKALEKNKLEDNTYNCEHICIEPFEMMWIENKNVQVIRRVVEKVNKSIFKDLKRNDILFIDSSHIIRPQGDVLFEYLEILPILNSGVLIHIHDNFTPKDYPEDWIVNQVRFWNEQYLLEAFMSFNNDYKILSALNFLKHNYFEKLSELCPILKNNPSAEPGTFWITKI